MCLQITSKNERQMGGGSIYVCVYIHIDLYHCLFWINCMPCTIIANKELLLLLIFPVPDFQHGGTG